MTDQTSPSHPSRRSLLLALGSAALFGPLVVADTALAAPDAPAAPVLPPLETTPAQRQFRALWIASVQRLDWPSAGTIDEQRAEYLSMLDYAVSHGMNAVIVQVRPTADSFWPNALEPWSRYASGSAGVDPGWDPMDFLVASAHERNLEFHAWFNPYRISMPASATEAGADLSKLPAEHPARVHPEWTVAYPVGNAASRLYYNPGVPEVRSFVQDAILDAVAKYDVDGVHFDDYFYPYPASGQDFGDAAAFAAYGAGWSSVADWRRNNIDLLIEETSRRIKALKPWVKFGVSPFGTWRNQGSDPLGSATNGTQSYDANFADTRKWVKQQWLDYIVPQVYWNIGLAVADYAALVPWWADVVAGTGVHLYIGQANYKVGLAGQPAAWFDPMELSRHLTFNQAYPDVRGDVHFRAKIVISDPLGSTTQLVADHYAHPALVPTMPQLPARPLLFPVITHAARTPDGVSLTVRKTAVGRPFGEVTSFAIYRDGAFLAAVRVPAGSREVSYLDTSASLDRHSYHATALDRLWNESPASPPRLLF